MENFSGQIKNMKYGGVGGTFFCTFVINQYDVPD